MAVYNVNFRLDSSRTRDQKVLEFLQKYPPRSRERKDFVLEAIAQAIERLKLSDFEAITTEIMQNLVAIKRSVIDSKHLVQQAFQGTSESPIKTLKVSTPEADNVVRVEQTPVEERPPIQIPEGGQEKLKDIKGVLDDLLAKAFE